MVRKETQQSLVPIPPLGYRATPRGERDSNQRCLLLQLDVKNKGVQEVKVLGRKEELGKMWEWMVRSGRGSWCRPWWGHHTLYREKQRLNKSHQDKHGSNERRS